MGFDCLWSGFCVLVFDISCLVVGFASVGLLCFAVVCYVCGFSLLCCRFDGLLVIWLWCWGLVFRAVV